jgi:hypothetical protein
MRPLLLALLVLSTFGCSEDKLPKYVALEGLRILALQADTPEVNPGSSVTITPYISDINNAGVLNFAWKACVDTGVAYGADPTCENNSTATTETTGTVSTLNAGNTFTASADSFVVSVPSTILASRSAREQYNGVNYLVVYRISDTQGRSVKSFKRIVVSQSTKTAKNANPSLTGVTKDGATVTSLSAGSQSTLVPTIGASSQESYTVQTEDGGTQTQTEELQLTWFYSDGELRFFRTLNEAGNTYTAPTTYPTTRSSFLVVVARDERGGISIVKVPVN